MAWQQTNEPLSGQMIALFTDENLNLSTSMSSENFPLACSQDFQIFVATFVITGGFATGRGYILYMTSRQETFMSVGLSSFLLKY